MLHLPDQSVDDAVGIFARDLDEQEEPGLTLDQCGDVTVLSSREEIALPVPGDRSVLYLGRPLSDGYRVNDLTARLSPGGGGFASAHQPPGAQTGDQLLSQDSSSLDEQALVDRLVGQPHRRVIAVFILEPAGYLLRRPIIIQFLRHHHLKGWIDSEPTRLRATGRSPSTLISIGRSIPSSSVIPTDLAADR
jgi:hypothetical protein